MILISITCLICWSIVGILNILNCIHNNQCNWIDYWLLYGVFILNLFDNIVEKLV